MLRNLEASERLPPDELEETQFRALAAVLGHACETVPYYRDRPVYREVLDARPVDAGTWRRLPFLTRSDLQVSGLATRSEAVPTDHLPVAEVATSGATGEPVRVLWTRHTHLLTLALTLREHVWQGRDSTRTLAAIKTDGSDSIPPAGRAYRGWGPGIDAVYPRGRSVVLAMHRDIAYQAEWLLAQNPDYLRGLPSNIAALARHFQATGTRLKRLRDVATFGETVGDDVRLACRDAWGVEIADIYGAMEPGVMALQCSESQALHVQSENVYLEVLDDRDRPCGPGEIGRVVVSALHNYATPLLRYELGDYAEVGDACACGRGLPVLARVVGRKRNMLRLPDGRQVWPRFPASEWGHLAPIRQVQLVQHDLDSIEARMLAARPLTVEEESDFTAVVGRMFTHPFRVTFTYLDRDAHSPTRAGKFEDFVSRL
jgi:phenylacetate-CoA ligase